MKCITMPVSRREEKAGRHIVSCGQPAKEEKDALVTGNGTFLFKDRGVPWEDVLTLNREELMSPQWHEPPKAPLIYDYLKPIREKILSGDYQGAEEMADMAAAQRGTPPTLEGNPSHPAIQLQIHQNVENAEDYLHTLDMRTSLITTFWSDNGDFSRSLFCSRADDLAALLFHAPKGRLNLIIKGILPHVAYQRVTIVSNDLPGHSDDLFDCLPVFPDITILHTPDSICLTGQYAYNTGGFVSVVLPVIQGGKVTADDDGIHIESAESALFLITTKRYHEKPADDASSKMLNELKSKIDSLHNIYESSSAENTLLWHPSILFDRLLTRHTAIHRPIFDRVNVDLGGKPEDYFLTTAELKEKQALSDRIVPAYLEAMLDMGRFFLMNECGKFPPIYGHVNINVNHQISGGNIGNLPEMMQSFFQWILWQLPDARENARRTLGTRGFFIACHPDEESGRLIHFNSRYPHHYWISSSGWCLQPFLEYYYCTADTDFLRQTVLPLFKELALLYEDFLTEYDSNGRLMFIPSYSPENFPANVPSMMNINATMDISVCRQVFDVLLHLGVEMGMVDEEEKARWEKLVAELPDYMTDQHGELKEWAWPEYEERYDHRHISQLYGAYPGDEFQPEQDPDLYRAAVICNRMHALGNESCHGIMHRAQAAARLKDSHLVEQLLRFTLESGYVTDAFTTTHNPYVKNTFPDGQGAIPTVVLESLLYSRPGFMEPLPAISDYSFRQGRMHGMASRTFAIIDNLSWDLNEGHIELTFISLKDQILTIYFRRIFETVVLSGTVSKPKYEGRKCNISVLRGERVTISWNGVKDRIFPDID